MYDFLIRNGLVIDGSGRPAQKADVAVQGDKVVRIAPNIQDPAKEVYDAAGKYVIPGLIDPHVHEEWVCFDDGSYDFYLKEGVTTLINGNCSHSIVPGHKKDQLDYYLGNGLISLKQYDRYMKIWPDWYDFEGYAQAVEQVGTNCNFVTLLGHGSIRQYVMHGAWPRKPDSLEQAQIERIIRHNMEQGMFGISFGLDYVPSRYADLDELCQVVELIKRYDGVSAAHLRHQIGIYESTLEFLEVDRIDILYGLGVRLLGVTYSESNALGNGLKEDNDGGLTKFGKACVERMNQVGMLIDVSHCGQKTAYDAVMHSKKPIIATHLGAKGVWNIKRMASDELIQAIAKKGGVVAIESAPHTTMSQANMTHDIDSVMEHFEYVKNMVGIDHVTFGPDCLYGDHVALHHAFAAALSTGDTSKHALEYQEVPYVTYLENTTEASWNILRWLVKHGYTQEESCKIGFWNRPGYVLSRTMQTR